MFPISRDRRAASTELDFPSFISKEFLCGSHINDESIHVSPEQLEFLNQPFVSGSYLGLGEATQSISLGFEPQVVIVVANQMPLIYCNHVAGTNAAYAGVALSRGSSLGVEITSTGFKVRSTQSEVSKTTYPLLNELGTTYCYAALR